MDDLLARVEQAGGFDWDDGNLPKIWHRHRVRFSECEEVFSGAPRLLHPDPRHSQAESRFVVHGRTRAGRWLGVVFTLRGKLIRVISARNRSNMAKRLKTIPKFASEEEERDFWATHDLVDYFDAARARPLTFPNLKPSTETISLRLPAGLLGDLKVLANRNDVPYQSLLKIYLAERVAQELRAGRSEEELAALVREPEAPYGQAPPGTHRPTATRKRRGKRPR